jgi:hypothetical protein
MSSPWWRKFVEFLALLLSYTDSNIIIVLKRHKNCVTSILHVRILLNSVKCLVSKDKTWCDRKHLSGSHTKGQEKRYWTIKWHTMYNQKGQWLEHWHSPMCYLLVSKWLESLLGPKERAKNMQGTLGIQKYFNILKTTIAVCGLNISPSHAEFEFLL